jgi:hypothetical protein
VFKDVTSYLGGWALIAYQALFVPPREVNAWFLLLGGSLIGVPGIAEIIAWRKAVGTDVPAGLPQPQVSPLPPSS